MRLDAKQIDKVLEWIAEGLKTDAINKRAARCRPPFKVSRQQVDHYRATREVDLDELREESESEALRTGLATRERRVELLAQLGELVFAELLAPGDESRLWLKRRKIIGRGEQAETINQYEFNAAGIAAARGLLDDIAKETGDRTYARFDDAEGDDLPAADPATSSPAKLEIEVRYVEQKPRDDDDGRADSVGAAEASHGAAQDQG